MAKKQPKGSKNKSIDTNTIYLAVIGALVILIALYGLGVLNLGTWFMPSQYTKVTDTTIDFYVGVSGNSWTVKLFDPSGAVIDTKSGYSYGSQQFPRPAIPGTYKFCLWTGYGSSHDGECETVEVPAIATPTPSPTPTPVPTIMQPTSTPTPSPTPTPAPTATESTALYGQVTPEPTAIISATPTYKCIQGFEFKNNECIQISSAGQGEQGAVTATNPPTASASNTKSIPTAGFIWITVTILISYNIIKRYKRK